MGKLLLLKILTDRILTNIASLQFYWHYDIVQYPKIPVVKESLKNVKHSVFALFSFQTNSTCYCLNCKLFERLSKQIMLAEIHSPQLKVDKQTLLVTASKTATSIKKNKTNFPGVLRKNTAGWCYDNVKQLSNKRLHWVTSTIFLKQ